MNPLSAFPIPFDDRPGSYPADPGMSLRDYFAAHASDADIELLCRYVPDGDDPYRQPADWRQRARYLHADRMMAIRNN